MTGSATAGRLRIGIGTFSQESNSFSPVPTDVAAFERYGYAVGPAVLGHLDNAGSSMRTFTTMLAAARDVEWVPLVRARTGAGGRVTREACDTIFAAFTEQLAGAGSLDAVVLELHGAMAAEHHDDPEGLLLELVRGRIGPESWLLATTDHHACITRRKVANADVIVGHRTQPHDPPGTGEDLARVLLRMTEGATPVVAMRKAPMITHQEQYLTAKPPMKIWFDLARQMETRPGVLSVSTYPMQPWLDVEEGGWASIVYTDNDPQLADELAEELTRCAWDLREQFMVQDSVPVAEAVARADAAERGIVVLSDTGDSMLGGAAGDSNVILAEMIAQGVTGTALVPLVDEPAALAAADAGVGATVTLRLGRAADPSWGAPITATAEVLAVTDGSFRAADWSGVIPERYAPLEQGTSALVKIGNVMVGISQHRSRGGIHPLMWQHFGVDATDRDAVQMVVVKTASNFQFYADWTTEVIRVDTPGHTQSRVTEFDWQRLPRPIFPLDDAAVADLD